jgi:hypothetical protein
MQVIWQSVKYKAEDVVSVYARLFSNGEVKFYDVNLKGQTIREWYCLKSELQNTDKLIEGDQVLWSGLRMTERRIALADSKKKPRI